MQVLQGRLRLRVVPMSGAVCKQRTPDLTGQDAEQGGNDGYWEVQAEEGESEGGTAVATDAADATRESGEGERRWKGGWAHDNTTGGRRNGGGRSGLHPYPRGPTSPGGLQRPMSGVVCKQRTPLLGASET